MFCIILNYLRKKIGLRFVVVEGYAKAYSFYALKNGFSHLKRDDDLIERKLDKIIRQNPEQTIYLYLDIKKINL